MTTNEKVSETKKVLLDNLGLGSAYFTKSMPIKAGHFGESEPEYLPFYGMAVLNKAIKELLAEGTVYINTPNNQIYSEFDHGFKSALSSKNWAIYATK